jgi:hypothetical protein
VKEIFFVPIVLAIEVLSIGVTIAAWVWLHMWVCNRHGEALSFKQAFLQLRVTLGIAIIFGLTMLFLEEYLRL